MQARASVIGVSPIIGDAAISGPAHILMRAQDWEPSAIGVANAYRDLLDKLLIDSADEKLRDRIRELGIQVAATSIRMESDKEKRRLAREVLVFDNK